MMEANFDAKKELLSTLEGNPLLSEWVKGGFHNLFAPDSIIYPRVIYQEIRNSDSDYADNEPQSAIVGYQISIYCDQQTISSQTKIAKEIDKTLKSIGYYRYDSQDLYEKEDNISHKVMRYEKKFM
ncbi:hypothetical protein [Cytobacillus purgationiresistens]|uniref:DUF3168 domain-containing protein n=1 Tax=Cytobacillus purgationiresistens TaxID=863449 RepID=A0ABU0ACV6_9BACI|nr:hypothetical protein [Cytobacillus purgationiresistens]MDQ0268875.1 hypothetical protein [Cytobacillus purgationiresistens]